MRDEKVRVTFTGAEARFIHELAENAGYTEQEDDLIREALQLFKRILDLEDAGCDPKIQYTQDGVMKVAPLMATTFEDVDAPAPQLGSPA